MENIQHWPSAPIYTHTFTNLHTPTRAHRAYTNTTHRDTHNTYSARKVTGLDEVLWNMFKRKNLTVNFGTREKISQEDWGILTVVREQAGLPSPGFVASSLKEKTLQCSSGLYLHFKSAPVKQQLQARLGRLALGSQAYGAIQRHPRE